MNIEFEYIEAQNFKSIGDLTHINYKDFNGLNFVIGNNLDNPGAKNGSGKTTLLVDCLIFALFGKTIKPIANQYLSNRYYKKKAETFVKLVFVADGIRYRSECYCHKSSLKMLLYQEDKDSENGWKDITQASILKTKQYIQDEILKCSFDVFKSAIIIAAADCLNFYDGMTKSQKREYIETVFNLNCFGDMYNEIKADLNNTKKEIQFTNAEILKLGNQLNQIKEKYELHKTNILEEEKKVKLEIVDKVKDCKEKQKEISDLQNNLDSINFDNNEYAKVIKEEAEVNDNRNKAERDIYKAEAKIDSINQVISEITKIKEGLCEVCTAKVNERYDFDKQVKGITALQKFIKDKKEIVTECVDKLKNIKNEKEEYENKLNEKNNLVLKIKNINLDISYLKDIIKKLKEQLDSFNNKNNPFKELYENTEKLLNESKDKLNTLNISYKHLDILKGVCSETGIKQYIIKDIVVLLNSLIQKYLNEIGAEFLVYFDEAFDFKFMTIDGECEYNNFSAGERQRIQIATILAMRDLILNGKINSNILVIDEVLDMAIDALAIKKIISILQRKTIDMNQALFIISHRSEITDENIFQHIIEVKKENGISTINII